MCVQSNSCKRGSHANRHDPPTPPALPQHTPNRAVIIDASGVLEIDLSALAVIDELVAEMAKQVGVIT